MPNHFGTNKKEVILFSKSIPANTVDVLQERVKSPGTIEKVQLRFYRGQQLALQATPFVEHKGAQIEHLISYPSTSKQYISGDDDNFDFDVVVTVDIDDFVKLRVHNTDATYAYDVVCMVTIDYYGGQARM
jgi:hypothetical protein